MIVLLTNDDGVFAPGLAAMTEAAAAAFAPQGEVYVAAPDHNCSGNSHHLNMIDPISVSEVAVPGAARAWAVGGTPADCVRLAVSTLLPRRPDVVISGINLGDNLSTDCLYSGTVGAAMEGLLMDLPALAVSVYTEKVQNASDAVRFAPDGDTFAGAAALGVRLVRWLMKNGRPMALNLNVPLGTEGLPPLRVVPIDRVRRYRGDHYTCTEENGRKIYRFVGAPCDKEDPSADIAAVEQGFAALTPLTPFWTDTAALEWLRQLAADGTFAEN